MHNESHDWRIYQDFALSQIKVARKLYSQDSFAVELEQTVFALDTTTIDLCLSVFPGAHFCNAKAAIKMHTLLDLRSNIPTFIHISDGKMQIQSTLSSHLLVRRGQVHWSALRLDYRANRTEGAQGLSATSEAHQVLRCRARQTSAFSNQQLRFACANHRSTLSLPLASRTILQMDKTASSDQEVLRHNQERSEDTNMDCHHRLRSGCHRQKTAQYRCFTLHNPTDFVVSRFINIDIY